MTAATTLDRVFDALANESRRQIVAHLSNGTSTTPDLSRNFDVSRQALNRHLQVLEEAGIGERRLHGRVHELRLKTSPLGDVSDWAASVTKNWNHNLDRLGRILKEQR